MARKPSSGGRKPPLPAEAVGYGQPPIHSRFVPGRSGNPAGRPKGARNLATEIQEILEETVDITERGAPRQVTMRHALAKSMVAKALKGDAKILALIAEKFDTAKSTQDTASNEPIEREDEEIIKRFLARTLSRKNSGEEPNG